MSTPLIEWLRAKLAEAERRYAAFRKTMGTPSGPIQEQILQDSAREVSRYREAVAAVEDKVRMDWLEREGHALEFNDTRPGVVRASDGREFYGYDLREAIDEALADEVLPQPPAEGGVR